MNKIYLRVNDDEYIYKIINDKVYYKSYGNKDNYKDILELFKISNNKILIDKDNEYDIYKDNETGLIHYIKDGIDDLTKLFLNNGVDAILYNNGYRNSNSKRFNFNKGNKHYTLIAGLSLFLALCSFESCASFVDADSTKEYSNEYNEKTECTSLEDCIKYNNNLDDKIKSLLENDNYFNYVDEHLDSDSAYYDEVYSSLSDLEINSYEVSFDSENKMTGYVDPTENNVINIKDWDINDSNSIDTLLHEFVHVTNYGATCSNDYFPIIIEGSAEIISCEFFDEAVKDSYSKQVKEMYLLMETIGTDCITDYLFNGDSSGINKEVYKYLYKEEADELIGLLCNKPKNDTTSRINELISIMYYNKYNKDITETDFYKGVDNGSLHKYYFNEEYMNDNECYYYPSVYYDLDSAYNNNLIKLYNVVLTEISLDEYKNVYNGDSSKTYYSEKNDKYYLKNYYEITLDDYYKNNYINLDTKCVNNGSIVRDSDDNIIGVVANSKDKCYIDSSIAPAVNLNK